MEHTEKEPKKEIDEEGMGNLVNFFSLLFKVDMRNNPERYRKKDERKPFKNKT